MTMTQLDPQTEDQLVLATLHGVAEHTQRLYRLLSGPELPPRSDAELRASVLGKAVHDVLFWANHPETIPPEADAAVQQLTEALFSTGASTGYTIPEHWWQTPVGERCLFVQQTAMQEEML